MVIDGIHLTVSFMMVLGGQGYVITHKALYIDRIVTVQEIAIIMRRVTNEATYM